MRGLIGLILMVPLAVGCDTGADEKPASDIETHTDGGTDTGETPESESCADMLTAIDTGSASGVCTGEYTAFNEDTLAELDGCEVLNGSLYVGEFATDDETPIASTIANLDALTSLTAVTGDLHIVGNESLINIDGLSNLRKVTGTLEISGNPALPGVDGLSSLTEAGNLHLMANFNLPDVDGLVCLQVVNGPRTPDSPISMDFTD
jgi:hypothetical protein